MTSKSETENSTQNNSFKNYFTKQRLLVILLLIFILAFSIRGHLLKYEYMFEYDPYWHLRATGYVLQGDLPDNDPLGFYAQGSSDYTKRPQLLWKFTALIYKVTTFGAPYDKWLLMNYARVLPAIFGALISVAMFFLGREIYNRKAGMVMALVSATIPAFVYRTMAGFFEEDALGFLWMVIGFIFLVKAIKNADAIKKHLIYGILSAVFFALMAFTWDMFLLIPLVLVIYFISNLIYLLYKKTSSKEILSFVKTFLTIFILFVALTSLYQGTSWIKKTTNYVGDYLPISKDNVDRIGNKNIPDTDIIGATVGEENTGRQFFLLKYNFLVWVPFVALLIMILYLLFSKNKDHFTLLLFAWIAVTLFMAWSKLKFTYTLGLPIAAGAGFLYYFLNENIEKLKSNKLIFRRIFAVFFAIIIFSSVAAGTHFVSTKVPPINEEPAWENAFFWLYDNTPEGTKILNWWDYGHWLTYFSERKASTDNTNSSVIADANFAQFIITDDIKKTQEILDFYDSDYLIVDSGYFNRYNSFAAYAYITTNFSDPRVTKYMGRTIPCNKLKAKDLDVYDYNCSGEIIPEDQFLTYNTKWVNKPTDILNGSPMYIYRAEDNSEIYIFNSEINNSIFAKIWFNADSVDDLCEIAYKDQDLRLFKFNKDYFKTQNN